MLHLVREYELMTEHIIITRHWRVDADSLCGHFSGVSPGYTRCPFPFFTVGCVCTPRGVSGNKLLRSCSRAGATEPSVQHSRSPPTSSKGSHTLAFCET